MIKCKHFRKTFVEYLFDEIDAEGRDKLEGHLAQCPKCSAELAKMKQTLSIMGERKRIEPTEEFWDNYWARLAVRMEQEVPQKAGVKIRLWEKIRVSLPAPAYKWATAVGILIIGILIGRFFFSLYGVKEKSIAEKPLYPEKESLAQTVDYRAESYLEKSKILLLGLVNLDTEAEAGEIDVSQQREISKRLIREASFLKENLKGHRRQRVGALIEDLEAILIEIANLEEKEDLPDIELIRGGIDRKGILLKIHVHQMRGNVERESSDQQETLG